MLSGGLNKRMYKAWTQSKHSVDISLFGSEVCRWEHSSKNKGWPGHPWGSCPGAHQWAKSSRQAGSGWGWELQAVPLDTGSEYKLSTPPAHMCSVAPVLKCDKGLVSGGNLRNAWQRDEDVQGFSPPTGPSVFTGAGLLSQGAVLSCPRPPPFFVLCDLTLHSPLYPARGQLRPVACWASKRWLILTSYPWHTLQLGYGLLPGGPCGHAS